MTQSIHFDHLEKEVHAGHIDARKLEKYKSFVSRIQNEVLTHEVIRHNQYTDWFESAHLTLEEVKHFIIQFSVFSNLFIEAQLKKVINAPTLEAMHASKQILMNELGVIFKTATKETHTEDGVDPELVGTEGSIEGAPFRFAAAHFEWLLRMVSHLDLTFNDIGKRHHGTLTTLFMCDELARLYGSEDPHIAMGASFGIENWAAAGFWKQLIAGLQRFKETHCPKLPLAFFLWHDRVEDQHAKYTWAELEEEYFSMELNEEKFIFGARQMLDGMLAFWNGLNQDRLKREPKKSAHSAIHKTAHPHSSLTSLDSSSIKKAHGR